MSETPLKKVNGSFGLQINPEYVLWAENSNKVLVDQNQALKDEINAIVQTGVYEAALRKKLTLTLKEIAELTRLDEIHDETCNQCLASRIARKVLESV